jgi:hypothetical protein
MNELETYVASLQDQGLSVDEIKAKVIEWKKNNKQEVVETSVEPVKTEDGAVGASAPSVGPQPAPKPTELTLEDGFSALPEVETEVEEIEVKEDGDWDFWKETGTKIKANTIDALGKLARVPTLINEFKAAVSREFMSEEEKARYDALDPIVKQTLANIGSQPGMTALANTGLEAYEDSVKKANVIRKDLTEFETSIGEEYAKGNFVEATVRTASDALGSLPSVVQSMIPYVGITSIVAGEAAGASAEAQKEGKDLSLETLGYSTIRGAAEGLLEVVTKKIGGGMFKNLAGKGKKEATESITKIVLGIGKDYGAEGLSETATEVINKMADAAQFGKKDTFDNHLRDLVDTFLVGGMMGGGMSSVGASAAGSRLIKNTIQDNSIQKDLEGTEYDSVVDAYETPDVTEGLPKLSENKFTQNKLESELKQRVGDGVFTVEQADNVRNNFRDIQGALNTVKPLGISVENTKPVVDLVIEQKKLKNKIKQVDNSSLTKAESERLGEIDKELNDIIVADKTAKIEKGAKVIAEQVGTGFETFENEADVASAIETLKEEGGEVDTKSSEDYGTFVVMPDGKRIIILNKESAAQDNVMTTAQHEVGHAVLFETVKNKPEAAIALGTSLLEELKNSKDITFTSSRFLDRFNQYVEDADISKADTMEEVLTLASEGLESGDIVFNEKATTKIGDFIRRALSAMGLNVKFKTGKDVLNFVRDYNRSVQKGKGLSRGLKKAAVEGAKVDIKAPTDIEAEITGVVTKESKKDTGIEASTKVQEIYDAQGVAGAFDIIEQFKPIVKKIVDKRQDAPNFDRQLLTDEIETGKRGILDLIRDYKPESGVPLAAFINTQLNNRAIEASRRVLGETFTEDVTEARGIAAEEVTTEVTEKPVTRKIKPSSLISNDAVTKIKEQVQEKIKGIDPNNLTFKKLGDLAPEIIAAEIGIPVKKLTVATANLSKGDATAIQQFVNKNADKLLKILPEGAVVEAATDKLLGTSTGVPKGLLNAFYTKQARLGKGAGLAPFKLNKGISKADFLETFGIVEGKKAEGFDARSPQAQALKGIASLYGKLVTNEIVRSDTDLSLEAKQDVAAGKSKAMASKRITTEAEMSPELKKLFKEVSQAKDINQALSIAKVDSVSINDSNRVEKQENLQNAIEKFKLDLNTFLSGSFAASGAVRSRSSNGDVYYSLSNGEKILGTRVMEDGKQKLNKSGKKMFNQPTLDDISTKFGQGVTLVASRGRLYYGATDPAYIKAKLAAEKNTKNNKFKAVKIGLPKGVETKINKNFLDKKAAQSKMNMDVLDSVVNQLSDAVAAGMPIEIAATIITQGYQATSGLIKIAAPFKYVSDVFSYALNGKASDKTGKKYREEHNPPASVVGASIILAIKNNAAKATMDALRNNYYQTQLSKSDDTKIDQAKLASTTVDGQTIFDNPISRLAAAGIDLQTLINPLTGKTIAEESGFGIDPRVYNKYNVNEKVQASSIQNEAILEGLKNPDLDVASKIKASLPLVPGKSMASKRDSDLIPDAIKYDRPIAVQTAINALEKTDKALANGRKLDQPVKKIRVFDFDDTLARTKSNVLYTMPDGTTGAIDAATFAKEAGNMEAEGAQWDFSEFSKVMQGSKGPLLDVAKIIADKRGTKDVFVLTARPADSAGPIKEFLASMGLDIPLANITGLGDGAPQAKAGWIMGKAAEGYNDFYFADDHTGNVKAVKDVLSQIDVKSKVQLAKASKRQTFDTVVNDMIEDSSGIETYKKYSAARAKTVGASKGKYAFLIPPSAEDFTGLLYKMIGKGKKGDAQMAFLKTNLLDTYNRAESAVTQAKISAANDFKALKTKLKTLPKTLSKQTGIGKFTYSHAVRVAAWTKQGMDIPGLSKRDIKELNDFVNKDAKLRVFTDELIKIQKGKEYPAPGKDWLGGNITTDIIGGINKVNRAEYQQEWRENIDIIFSEDNLNKMEAAYGTRWREAMEDSIRRMKAGTNRPIGGNRVTEGLLNWLNNSVGAVMFLNTRSALLQTISAVNFINLGDNNIIKAGRAFANQKQFWGDFMTLMNSDYLVERRNGLKINVSESEIADAVRESKNKPKAAIAFLLSKGFVMTRFADSFAIASGGSTFYRNRLEALKKQGLSEADAAQQAFEDFKAIAEENQQSSSPSKISQQQASAAGRVILAWANTPMQYARIQKRAAQDLINGRGDWRSNVSKIVYYGAIQNLIFNSLQQAVFALGFGDDEEETDEAKAKKRNDKAYKIANGMIDSQLKGLGIFGAASAAVKNTLMTLYEEYGKKGSKYENAVDDLLSFSPPLGSKIGKIKGGFRSFSWNMKDMKEKGFSLDNPAYMAGAQVITGFTNIPLDRVAKKINNLRGLVNERSSLWQKVALGLGWGTWELGLGYYGGFDKEKPLTPEQQLQLEVDTMKKDTSKADQVKTLLDFGLTKKQIRELKNENDRVKKILELQKKDKK